MTTLSVVLVALYTLVSGHNGTDVDRGWDVKNRFCLALGIAYMRWLLASAALSALVAFINAHFTAWYITAKINHSVWVSLGWHNLVGVVTPPRSCGCL